MHEPTSTDTPNPLESDEAPNRGAERASTLRTAAIGAGLGIFTVIGIGAGTSALAGAQSDDPPASESTEDPTADSPARGEHLAEALAPLVEDGTLTQEQADAVVARLREAGTEAREARGERQDGRRGPDGLGGHRFPGESATAVADLIGLTPEEMRTAIRDGSSLADLAADAGVTSDQLLDAMLSGVQERLAERVAEGDLTQEQADERLARATERATAVIEGERPS
jgi:polyhydroxyalkanoate synthesis regulator phasin